MPKDSIYEVVRPSRILQDDGSWKDEEPREPGRRVEVAWARDMWVQIGATRRLSAAEAEEADKDLPVPGPTEDRWDGPWMDLDRHQINELIRVLRRARDQAFGRDE